MKRFIAFMLFAGVCLMSVGGCNDKVNQGEIGRVKTTSGWNSEEAIGPGHHSCYGRDTMYKADASEKAYTENLSILVGGKVNLKISVTVRCGINIEDKKAAAKVFDKVKADGDDFISHKSLYDTYVKLVLQSAPMKEIGSKPDVESVIADIPAIEENVRKKVTDAVSGTPMRILALEFTNYDWPEVITNAQEKLAEMKLSEETEAAKVRAELRRAEGQLKVEEANKLIELKKAEAIAESIDIISDRLTGKKEFLAWHQVRMFSEAAQGPNNMFLLFPYNVPGMDAGKLVANANLKQMLDQKK